MELARAKDAKERMAGVERLRQMLVSRQRNPLSSPEVSVVVGCCLDLLRDGSVRVSHGALQALADLAAVSGELLKPHFNALVHAAVNRLGDAKQPVRDSARRLLLTLTEVSSPKIIVERAGSYAWKHKSWRVREEFSRTVTSAIGRFAPIVLPLYRVILPPILQMLSDPNPALREAAISCIEEMYTQAGIQFREELHRYNLPINMVNEINARLDRMEPEVGSSEGFSGREVKHVINEVEEGIHRRDASPVNSRGAPMGFSPQSASNMHLYGTSATVSRDRSSCSPGIGTERVLETVSQSSKEKVSAIENMLRGLDLAEKHKSKTRSSCPDLGGVQDRKALNGEKPFAGCLGRMVNLFDLGPGVAGNRMLMDRPHHDGYSLARSQSDIARISSPFGDKIEDKMIVSELRRSSSNKKGSGTPMKMLLDQEMSKEFESKNEPPNVVAKLMGLDELPRQQHQSLQRSNTNGYSRSKSSHSGVPLGTWEQGLAESRTQLDDHQCSERNEFKDVYEVWQQPQSTDYARDSPQKERHNSNTNDRKMALVRQKFMEAKRLATDEKLRQSKEFQDALEVLSSNRDLFLKFLQEPNSLFSEHLYDMQSIPVPPETKRITVLRPSKIVDNEIFSLSAPKNDKQVRKTAQVNPERSPVFYSPKVDEHPAPPTRIVVLRPSTGKTHDIRAVVSSPISSPRVLHVENLCGGLEDDEAQESKEVAKQITRHMRDNLMGHRRDETLLSSVFSNGYTGDESSFNENEFAAENLSDSEVMSPSSRHSWDYVNRLGSPFSSSCFSRASCSPESSVCREAKKRLSERWAMVASHGISQEQRHVRKSSSTLGEMLALSDVRKPTRSDDDEIKEESEPIELGLCLNSNSNKEDVSGSPRSLLRSKSVPVISTMYDGSDAIAINENVPKELTKAKSSKSSLKGKVSSLFFSRSKKSSKEKSGESQSASEIAAPRKIDGVLQSGSENGREECVHHMQRVSSGSTSAVGTVSRETGLSLAKPIMAGITGDNQDQQPSPISVLEPHFEEDDSITRESSGHVRPNPQGLLMRSNLLDKSPPIGSISRTLSWDESRADTFSTKPSSSVLALPEEEDTHCLAFVRTLLSSAGLEADARLDSLNSDLPKWHSPESPLDPSLREKYAEDKDPLRRQRRSIGKLVFDRVSADLADITTTTVGCERPMEGRDSPATAVDFLWARMKEWFSGETRWDHEDGDVNSLAVDGVVRREILGREWVDLMAFEIHNLGKEIEGKLLQELVEEAVVDLI